MMSNKLLITKKNSNLCIKFTIKNKIGENKMTKKLVYVVIGMLLCAAVISVAGTKNTFDSNIENNRSDTDWPMFGHDPQHTRVADSTAPPNKLLWSYNTTDKISSSPAIVDNKVYIGSYSDKIYCLDAITGSEIWNYTTGGDVYSSPAVANDIVYVGSTDGKVYYLNKNTGEFIDSFQTGDEVIQSPTVANGKVYIASTDQKLYCLDADSALELWNFTTDTFSRGTPSVIDNKVIYVNWDATTFCLDAEDGSTIWTHETEEAGMFASPSVANNKVYFGTIDRKFFCLDLIGNGDGTTTELWNYSVDSMIRSSAAVVNNKVIFSSTYFQYCLDAESGEEIWTYDTNSVTLGRSSPAVADGKVYFGSSGDLGTIYCLNLSDGDQLWKRFTGDFIHSSFSIAGGRGYFGSYDGNLYCLGTDDPILKIENITGGDGVTVLVKNTGLTEATGVTINITFSGGLLIIPKEYDYPDTIAPEESIEVNMAVIGIGLGIFTPMPVITVTAECVEGSFVEQSQEAKVFFSQVILSE